MGEKEVLASVPLSQGDRMSTAGLGPLPRDQPGKAKIFFLEAGNFPKDSEAIYIVGRKSHRRTANQVAPNDLQRQIKLGQNSIKYGIKREKLAFQGSVGWEK